MSEWKEYSAKTVEEALTNALVDLGVTSDKVDYEVVEKESNGLLGLFSKPAVIRAKVKDTVEDIARDFLNSVFEKMSIEVNIDIELDESGLMNIDLSGDEMGLLIGKRGITLDSLQYLVSLVINKGKEDYIKVKLDTENYRERRKETLENLAKNLARKVSKTGKAVSLEPMNPYERRVIHSALQKDKFVETHSEGEEPYRNVIISLKPGIEVRRPRNNRYSRGGKPYGKRGGYNKKRYDNRDRSYEKKEADYSAE